MSENIQAFVAIIIVICAFGMTRRIMAWLIHKSAVAVVNDLRALGAFDSETAVDPAGIITRGQKFGFRNYRAKAMEGLVTHGFVGVTEDGRYFLKPSGNELYPPSN